MRLFRTENLTTGYRGPGAVGGVCMAMTCDWAATSLRYDGVRHKGLLNSGKWNILQAAYHFGIGSAERWRSTAEAAGLTVLEAPTIEAATNIHDFAEAVPSWLAERSDSWLQSTWLVIMSGTSGGHATGFRRNSNVYEFFDPNTGLWRSNNESDFLEEVNPMMVRYGSSGIMDQGVAAVRVVL